MKKIMVIGRVGCGKTTLCQRLFHQELRYKKTQAIELLGGCAIDTPGEYVESRAFYRALVVSAVDADIILILQDCTDPECRFAPGLRTMFQKPMIGLITKIDRCTEPEELERSRLWLELAGADPILPISSQTGEGIELLRALLGGPCSMPD